MLYDRDSVEIPNRLQKYWRNRYLLFARFDDGIRLDEQAFYSVKPEILADEIAGQMPGQTVFDAFCGAGGTAIAFARAGKRVITCDNDPGRLELARHNAGIYRVTDRISFVHGDAQKLLAAVAADSVYFDPPWGGIDYRHGGGFRFCHFMPDGMSLIRQAAQREMPLAFSLPRNFAISQLRTLDMPVRVEDSVIDGKLWFRNLYAF